MERISGIMETKQHTSVVLGDNKTQIQPGYGFETWLCFRVISSLHQKSNYVNNNF